MIDAAINHIANSVNQHLMLHSEGSENIVVVSNILEQDGTVASHVNDKIVISLVNIEKESVPLSQTRSVASSGLRSIVTSPPIHFNLYLMFASYFSGGNYQTGLKLISDTITYLQGQSVFNHKNSPGLDRGIEKLVLDIENLDINDLSNLWSILSGKYLPSVLYKVRMVTIDAGSVKGQTPRISKPGATMRG